MVYHSFEDVLEIAETIELRFEKRERCEAFLDEWIVILEQKFSNSLFHLFSTFSRDFPSIKRFLSIE